MNTLPFETAAPRAAAPVLAIRELRKSFAGNEILRGVSLSMRRGEVVALIGPSGSGKSTLLRCINALEHYESGDVCFLGKRLSYVGSGRERRRLGDRRLAEERARIGMVFQSYALFPHLTAEQNVMLALRRVHRIGKREARERSRQWLANVGLGELCDRYPHQLSGGQQQRTAIARALAQDPELMLLDEVTSALDPELTGEVLAVIRQLAASGKTMLVVSHEMAFVREVADTVAFMQAGRIVASGPPSQMFGGAASPRLGSFLDRVRGSSRDRASVFDGDVMVAGSNGESMERGC